MVRDAIRETEKARLNSISGQKGGKLMRILKIILIITVAIVILYGAIYLWFLTPSSDFQLYTKGPIPRLLADW
jgi:flagellar basal body-associated protein FliL